jgi:hypothetical protein
MIYDKLRTLPKVVQEEISNTGDLHLLTDDPQTPIEILTEVWEKLCDEFNARFNDKSDKEVFEIYKHIEFEMVKHDLVKMCVEFLRFNWSDEVAKILAQNGFKVINDEKLFENLTRIEGQANGILLRVKLLEDKLPKKTNESEKTTVIDAAMAYMAILNLSFDPNTISVEAFHAMEKQVKQKIEQAKKSIEQSKSKLGTKK